MARPRRVRTTDSRHDFPIALNLFARNFTATAPNNGKCELPHTRKAFSQIQLPPDIEFKLTLKACLKEASWILSNSDRRGCPRIVRLSWRRDCSIFSTRLSCY
jgi:hypothetical protein